MMYVSTLLRNAAAAGLVLAMIGGPAAQAVTVGVEQSGAPWLGFMNVFNLPAPDGDGVYQYGDIWGVADLTAAFDDGANTLTLGPNTIGDPDPYWYIGGGGPGAPGNKIMDANLYIEVSDGSLSGTTVTFEGEILSNSYTDAHEAYIFIRDFAPDFSSRNEVLAFADPGPFSIELATDPGAGRHVQFGFQSVGVNVWFTDVDPFGNVVIETIPEPASLALMGLGALAVVRRR